MSPGVARVENYFENSAETPKYPHALTGCDVLLTQARIEGLNKRKSSLKAAVEEVKYSGPGEGHRRKVIKTRACLPTVRQGIALAITTSPMSTALLLSYLIGGEKVALRCKISSTEAPQYAPKSRKLPRQGKAWLPTSESRRKASCTRSLPDEDENCIARKALCR